MTLINLPSKGAPIQIVSAGDPATLIVNRDLVNQVWYGPLSITDGNIGSYSVIDPLGSVNLDGSQDVYAMASASTVQADVVQGSTNWSPSPAQIAAQISALGLATAANQATQIVGSNSTNSYLSGSSSGALISNTGQTIASETAGLVASGSVSGTPGGIPLLRYTNNLSKSTATNLPAGGTTAITLVSAASINQPGYEAEFTCHFSAGIGTSPFVELVFTWSDSASGFTTRQVFFYIPGGSGASNTITCYLVGPCNGNTLTVTATNTDASAGAALDSWVVSQTSHVYETDKIVQYAYTSVFGFTNPDGVPGTGVVCAANPSIAASSSVTRLLAAYSGKVGVSIDNLGGTNALRIRFLDPTGELYSAANDNKDFFGTIVAATAGDYQEIGLPRGPVVLEMHNQGSSGSITPAVVVTAMDY